MESQYKVNSNGGIESGATATTRVANKRNIRGWDLVLRFSALALSLAAAVVLGVDKETTTVSMTLVPTLPAVNVPVTAKWHYLSAFVFFVVANAIACAHAAISLLLTLANRGGNKGIALMVVLFDLVMVALLFSGIGAALAIGLMGYEGNSHVQWKKVCNVFDKFCDQAAAAMGLSGAASVAFFLLVVLATLNLHKKH
ncbi:UNVERIFIED_CONTAM: CASP-like protein 1E2 [Sesamum angustifolium]|uniref:CASP-like protein n=1 Tax=Sesamum angustifolium TaxID=2727405 RepID=A0AAW2NY05_9LAMI